MEYKSAVLARIPGAQIDTATCGYALTTAGDPLLCVRHALGMQRGSGRCCVGSPCEMVAFGETEIACWQAAGELIDELAREAAHNQRSERKS